MTGVTKSRRLTFSGTSPDGRHLPRLTSRSLDTIAAKVPAVAGKIDHTKIGAGGAYIGGGTSNLLIGTKHFGSPSLDPGRFSDPRVLASLALSRRYRPGADQSVVGRGLQRVPGRRFAVSDVSPFDDVDYAKELLRAMIPLKKKWGGLATTRIVKDPELFDLLVKSGCNFLLIGFESVVQSALNGIYKAFNRSDEYDELVRQLHRAHIVVQGCFVFGFDHDTTDVFRATVDRVNELKIDIPRYSIYTPYPGTRLFGRLEAEGRMLSYDWGDYDTMHVVFRPKQMSPVELYEGFRWAYRETFRFGSILRRCIAGGRLFPVTFVGNLAYRLFVKRLYRSRGFQMPIAGGAEGRSEATPRSRPSQAVGLAKEVPLLEAAATREPELQVIAPAQALPTVSPRAARAVAAGANVIEGQRCASVRS